MGVPKADEASREWFGSLVPDAPSVTVRPMFGNLAAFVNANMFLALLGEDVAVRLPEDERATLLKERGAAPFAPMPERPMREYVVLPRRWRERRAEAEMWVQRSLAWASTLPPKESKARRKGR